MLEAVERESRYVGSLCIWKDVSFRATETFGVDHGDVVIWNLAGLLLDGASAVRLGEHNFSWAVAATVAARQRCQEFLSRPGLAVVHTLMKRGKGALNSACRIWSQFDVSGDIAVVLLPILRLDVIEHQLVDCWGPFVRCRHQYGRCDARTLHAFSCIENNEKGCEQGESHSPLETTGVPHACFGPKDSPSTHRTRHLNQNGYGRSSDNSSHRSATAP